MTTTHRPHRISRHLLLGHLFGYLPDKLGFLVSCAATSGGVVDLSLGPKTYLVTNPDDIRHILVTNHLNYTKTRRLTGQRGKRLSGGGLLTESGQAALERRRILQPLLSGAALEGVDDVIVGSAQELMGQWRPGDVIDIADEMMRLTQRVIGRLLFSVDFAGAAKGLADAIATRQRYIHRFFKWIVPWPDYLPTRINRDYRRASQYIDRAIYTMIASRRASSSPPPDMLSQLMQVKHKDGRAMNDRQVRDEALTIASTGYETIGTALAWTFYLLAQHPDVTQRLASELRRVLAGRPPRIDDVPKLEFTQMVLSEAMRIYPPTWIFVRVPQQDDRLPVGFDLRAGSKVYLSPYVTHRNPSYFPNPEHFDPRRFTSAAVQSRPKFAYFPFAGGPRICLGQKFAMLEGVLVLACIAAHFTLERASVSPVEPDPGQTLFPKSGIHVRVQGRAPDTVTDCAAGTSGR